MRIFCIISIIAFFFSIVGLFKIKLYVQSLNTELVKIKSEISLAQSDLKVLQAEWSYLNNPTRLARLARKYLRNNSLILTNQIKSLDSLQGN
jgi:cell division protein FtsL